MHIMNLTNEPAEVTCEDILHGAIRTIAVAVSIASFGVGLVAWLTVVL